MKRIIKVLLAVLIIFLFLIQFIRPVRNQSGQAGINDLSKVYKVPVKLQAILKRSCYDCHSNYTNYPWYAEIQPVRYFLDSHITEGKEELNFEEFNTYSARKRSNKLRAIVNSLQEKEMPVSSYLMIHHQARLSKQETNAIIAWIKTVDSTI